MRCRPARRGSVLDAARSTGHGWANPGWSCAGFRPAQVADPNQVVDGGREGEHPAHSAHASMPGLPQQRDRLEPPEDLLHEFALLLAHRVARVPRRAPIDGTAPVRGVLRDTRGDAPGPERRDEVAGVVALVGPEGGAWSQATDQRPR